MAPTQVREPFHRDGWVYEEKVDGWRTLAYKDGARVRLISRNGRDHTRRFAGIVAAIAKLSARSLVLDGEVAIFDEQLRSRFDWLREPDADAIATPPMFIAFDVLHRDGRELTGRALRERRDRLEDVVDGSEHVLPVRRLAGNGFEAWSEVIARDCEGYVAKDESSLYEAGPTRRWLKVKQKGWTGPRGVGGLARRARRWLGRAPRRSARSPSPSSLRCPVCRRPSHQAPLVSSPGRWLQVVTASPSAIACSSGSARPAAHAAENASSPRLARVAATAAS
jgi:hypothetical protein